MEAPCISTRYSSKAGGWGLPPVPTGTLLWERHYYLQPRISPRLAYFEHYTK